MIVLGFESLRVGLGVLLGLLGLAFLVRIFATRFVLAHVRALVANPGYRPDLEPSSSLDPGDELVIMLHGTFCDGPSLRHWGRALHDQALPHWIFEYDCLASIPKNARRFDRLTRERLESLSRPPKRIVLLGYSQGGMILRWLLLSRASAWMQAVVGWIQVASPNRGADPAWLQDGFFPWPGGYPKDSSLSQMKVGSRWLSHLETKSFDPRLRYACLRGEGRGRDVLARFLRGDLAPHPLVDAVGWIYERFFLPRTRNDGLVSEASSVALEAVFGALGPVASHCVQTDHLGLLVSTEAAQTLAGWCEEFLRGGVPLPESRPAEFESLEPGKGEDPS